MRLRETEKVDGASGRSRSTELGWMKYPNHLVDVAEIGDVVGQEDGSVYLCRGGDQQIRVPGARLSPGTPYEGRQATPGACDVTVNR